MILASYESMRVNFAINAYGATPTRGPDGRFVFPTTVETLPRTGASIVNVFDAAVADEAAGGRVFPWKLTVNSGAADSAARTDEWDWYLWQEAGFLQLLRDPTETLTTTRSGTAYLYFDTNGATRFASDTPINGAQRTVFASDMRSLLRASYVYVQQRSTGTVVVIDLSAVVFGGSVGNVIAE